MTQVRKRTRRSSYCGGDEDVPDRLRVLLLSLATGDAPGAAVRIPNPFGDR